MSDSGFWVNWLEYFNVLILPAIWATLRMVFASLFFATILAVILGAALAMTHPRGLRPCAWFYNILSFLVNSVRSYPFIVLIVAIAPFTRLVVGTMIGEAAAILALTIGGAPYLAKILENALIDVDPQLIEAARSFGASDIQIVTRVMMREAVPNIINGGTFCAINFLKSTTLAGAVGAGGLGAIALSYGFYNFNNTVLYTAVIILLIMVQLMQWGGDYLYKINVK